MLVNEAKLQAWSPWMLSVLRIMTALLFLQYRLSKYFGFPANPPANFHMFSLMARKKAASRFPMKSVARGLPS